MYTVYMHKTPNNKVYIGVTCHSVLHRWHSDGSGYKTQTLFWRAIQKYGWNNIEHIIIAENLTKEDAYKMETVLIAQYKSNNSEFGYNTSLGGEHSHCGCTASDELRKKLSDAHKGKSLTEGQLNNLKRIHARNRGKSLSDETKAKISKANSGKVRTPEMVEAMRLRATGKPSPNKGKLMSEEQKEKIRKTLTGHKVTEETREKLRNSSARYWQGKSRSKSTKEKIRKSLTGRHLSEETKAKVSASMRRYRASMKEKQNECQQR